MFHWLYLSYTSSYDAINKGYFQQNQVCKDMVNGKIPGNGAGGTCGRIGGLVQLGNTMGLVYVRKACSLAAYKGGTTSNTVSEIALITFQFTNNVIGNLKYYSFGNGDLVVAIRAGKYGSNIFITYSLTTFNTGNDVLQQYLLGDKTVDTQYTMLVDFNGNVITPASVNTGNFCVSASDEIRFLNDGTTIWSYIDLNNKLFIYNLKTPPQLNNIITLGTIDPVGGSSGSGSSSGTGTTSGTNTTSGTGSSSGTDMTNITGSSIGMNTTNSTSNNSSGKYVKTSILIVFLIIFMI